MKKIKMGVAGSDPAPPDLEQPNALHTALKNLVNCVASREPSPLGFKRQKACRAVLKKLDNFSIACPFSPYPPTFLLV